MSDWKPYLDDRLIKHCDGFVVIKPTDADNIIPMCCPLCDTMFRSSDDENAYIDFGCCHFCAMTWAHPRRGAWNDGWRPTREQIIEVLATRSPLKLVLVTD